jgi:hypothetical protein
MPLGHNCETQSASTPNGRPNSHYCSSAFLQRGTPATGSGTLILGSAGLDTIALEQSAFGVTATGFLPNTYPQYIQTQTYATFVNTAATFFAGGGPAAGKGTHTKTGAGQTVGRWVIREGANGFGGAMGLLGRFGAKERFPIPGKVGTYSGTMSWAVIPPMGRAQYATPIRYSAMGKVTRWQNPYVNTGVFANNYNSKIYSLMARGTGTPWTTGTVAVYAREGAFPTILHRTGFDTTSMVATPMGSTTVRNIQLVTPTLTHWIGPGYQTHTGHIGILTLQVPEPGHVALLAAGACALVLLRRSSRRH